MEAWSQAAAHRSTTGWTAVLFVTGGLNRSNPPYESAERFKGSVYVLSVI